MKKNFRFVFVLIVLSISFSCTSISSNLIDHQYVVEKLVKQEGLDLNQVTQINILLDNSIYNDFLPEIYYKNLKNTDETVDYVDQSNDVEYLSASKNEPTEKKSFFSKEEIARRNELNAKKLQSYQFANCIKKYIETFYHNRGLQKPTINILTKSKNFFGHELTISINKLDIDFLENWEELKRDIDVSNDRIICYHNNIVYNKDVRVSINCQLLRFDESQYCEDLSSDVKYSIDSSNCIEKNYKSMDKVSSGEALLPKIETFAKQNINSIDKNILYKGAIDKIFRQTFGKTLIPVSKDVVYFKYGRGEQFNHAQACLKVGRYDEALAVWCQIYEDEGNPTFARGVAAYNIAMCKTLERDYESANMYFSISEDLRADGLQNLERF